MDEIGCIEIIDKGDTAVVAFRAVSISASEGIDGASEQIRRYIEENHPKKIVFDFEQVKFFSSQVLGLLLDVRAKLQMYDGEVVISAINPQLHRIFKITSLDKIFRFFPDKETAVKTDEHKSN